MKFVLHFKFIHIQLKGKEKWIDAEITHTPRFLISSLRNSIIFVTQKQFVNKRYSNSD